jgi:hypothetical protein
MPRASLTTGAFREPGAVDRHEALKLERGESHRLWIPSEDGAWMEYRHNIKAPVFDEQDRPLMAQKKIKGGFKTVFDMEDGFIASPICLGDPEVIRSPAKLDPAGCPSCAGIQKMLDDGITDALDLKPVPRYAVPVVRYETVSKRDLSKGLRTPPNAEVLVWSLSQWSWEQVDKVREQMAEILSIEDPKTVKLQYCDICVTNENGYQKIDKIWPLRCAWRHDSDLGREVKAVVQALWGNPENRPTDAQLRAACGKEPDREWMMRDVEDAAARWHKAVFPNSGGSPDRAGSGALTGSPGSDQSLDGLLDDLVGAPAEPAEDLAAHPGGLDEFSAPAAVSAAAPASDLDDPFGGPAAAPPAATSASDLLDDPFGAAAPASAPATTPAAAAASAGAAAPASALAAAPAAGKVESFDSIMEGIGG